MNSFKEKYREVLRNLNLLKGDRFVFQGEAEANGSAAETAVEAPTADTTAESTTETLSPKSWKDHQDKYDAHITALGEDNSKEGKAAREGFEKTIDDLEERYKSALKLHQETFKNELDAAKEIAAGIVKNDVYDLIKDMKERLSKENKKLSSEPTTTTVTVAPTEAATIEAAQTEGAETAPETTEADKEKTALIAANIKPLTNWLKKTLDIKEIDTDNKEIRNVITELLQTLDKTQLEKAANDNLELTDEDRKEMLQAINKGIDSNEKIEKGEEKNLAKMAEQYNIPGLKKDSSLNKLICYNHIISEDRIDNNPIDANVLKNLTELQTLKDLEGDELTKKIGELEKGALTQVQTREMLTSMQESLQEMMKDPEKAKGFLSSLGPLLKFLSAIYKAATSGNMDAMNDFLSDWSESGGDPKVAMEKHKMSQDSYAEILKDKGNKPQNLSDLIQAFNDPRSKTSDAAKRLFTAPSDWPKDKQASVMKHREVIKPLIKDYISKELGAGIRINDITENGVINATLNGNKKITIFASNVEGSPNKFNAQINLITETGKGEDKETTTSPLHGVDGKSVIDDKPFSSLAQLRSFIMNEELPKDITENDKGKGGSESEPSSENTGDKTKTAEEQLSTAKAEMKKHVNSMDTGEKLAIIKKIGGGKVNKEYVNYVKNYNKINKSITSNNWRDWTPNQTKQCQTDFIKSKIDEPSNLNQANKMMAMFGIKGVETQEAVATAESSSEQAPQAEPPPEPMAADTEPIEPTATTETAVADASTTTESSVGESAVRVETAQPTAERPYVLASGAMKMPTKMVDNIPLKDQEAAKSEYNVCQLQLKEFETQLKQFKKTHSEKPNFENFEKKAMVEVNKLQARIKSLQSGKMVENPTNPGDKMTPETYARMTVEIQLKNADKATNLRTIVERAKGGGSAMEEMGGPTGV